MAFDFNKQFEKMMREYDVTEVVLLGHMNPDGDAAGSVMGLAHYIKGIIPSIQHGLFCQINWIKARRNRSWRMRFLLLLSVRSWRLKGMR